MREDRSIIVFMHLSALFGGVIIPLIIWATQKDKVIDMDEHGKAVVNFQLTNLIFTITIIFLAFFCIGFLLLPLLLIYQFVFGIRNAMNAHNGLPPQYPLSIRFIK